MGVEGSGKTTVGHALAARLGWEYADADDYHSAANIAKMSAGIALTDEDRAPWLAALRAVIDGALREKRNLIMGSSALKEKYRRELMAPGVRLVYLRGDKQLIAERLRHRRGHFAGLQLLASQFEQLEEPSDAIVVDIRKPVGQIVEDIVRAVGVQ